MKIFADALFKSTGILKIRHRYSTSSSRHRIFYPPRAKSKSYLLWISNAGIKLWESIDDKIKSITLLWIQKTIQNKTDRKLLKWNDVMII